MAGEDKGELLLRYWGNDSVEQQEPQEQPVGRHSMDGAAAFAAPTLEHNHSDTAEVNAESVDALECWLELNLPDDLVFTDNNCNALLASVQLPDQAPVMMDCDGFEDYVQHYTQSLAESMLVEDSSISAPITEQDAYDLINVRATSESSTVPSEPTKPFACFFDQCESRFAKKAHLIDHERVHTGLFACSFLRKKKNLIFNVRREAIRLRRRFLWQGIHTTRILVCACSHAHERQARRVFGELWKEYVRKERKGS